MANQISAHARKKAPDIKPPVSSSKRSLKGESVKVMNEPNKTTRKSIHTPMDIIPFLMCLSIFCRFKLLVIERYSLMQSYGNLSEKQIGWDDFFDSYLSVICSYIETPYIPLVCLNIMS